jgi:hypothetical protein
MDQEQALWLARTLTEAVGTGVTHFQMIDLDHCVVGRVGKGKWETIAVYKSTTPWVHPDEVQE